MDIWYIVAFLGGLILFLGTHFFSAFRNRTGDGLPDILGRGPYMAIYSVLTAAGFIALVWGYAMIKPWIYLADPPPWMKHITMALMLPAIILIVAAYVPTGFIKKAVKHPMLTAVKLWALAHLIAELATCRLDDPVRRSFLVFGVDRPDRGEAAGRCGRGQRQSEHFRRPDLAGGRVGALYAADRLTTCMPLLFAVTILG